MTTWQRLGYAVFLLVAVTGIATVLLILLSPILPKNNYGELVFSYYFATPALLISWFIAPLLHEKLPFDRRK